MSSLAGICSAQGEFDPASHVRVGAMLRRMAARGCDDSGIHNGSAGVLGCNRYFTSSTDALGVQPVGDIVNDVWVVADARLDNRDELRDELDLGLAAEDMSDAELILRCYLKWGCNTAQQLEGDFAFAVWDNNQRQLYAAVDAFAVRPFYFHYADNCLAFASSINGLMASELFEPQVDDDRAAAMLGAASFQIGRAHV